MRLSLRFPVLLLMSAALPVGCADSTSVSEPIYVAAASQVLPQYEFRSHCGKPCQPVVVRWQQDGRYTVQRGEQAEQSGQLSADAVRQLPLLFAELKRLTQGLPADLTRAAVCREFATDHAIKQFAVSAAERWQFRDNHGCKGFPDAEAVRNLEQKIEQLLPVNLAY